MDNAADPNGTSELVKLGLQPHNSNSNNRTILLRLLLKEDCLVPSDPSALGPMSPFTKEGQILRKSAGVPFILPGEAEMVITSPKVRSLCSDEECKHSKYSEIVNEGYLSSVVRNGGGKLISRWLHCVPVDDRLPDELIFSVECSSVSELFQLIEEAVANRIPQGLQWFRLKELHYTDMPVTVTDNREGTKNAIPESISLLLSSLTEDKSTAATNSDDIPKSIMALINTKNDTVGDANGSVGDANGSVGDDNGSVGDDNGSVGEVSAPISCENGAVAVGKGAVAVGKGDSIGGTTLSTLSSMKRVPWTILQRDASFTPETISVSMYQKLPSRVALDVNTSFNSTKSSGVSSIVSKDRECFSNQDKGKNRIPSLLQQIDEHLSSVPRQVIAKVLCFPRRISFVVTCILTEQDVKRIQLRNVASKTSKYKSRWNSSLVPDCCLSTNPTIKESSLEIDMNMPAELFQRHGTAMVATIGDLVNALRSLLNLNVEPHQILFLNPALHDERQKEQIPQSQGQTASNTSYYYPLEAISQLSDFIYIICDMCDSGSMYPGCGEKNILTQRSASLGSPYIDSLIAERNSSEVRQNALGHGQQRNAQRYLNDIPRGERHGDQVMANEGLIHTIKKSSRQSCSSPYSSSCYAGDVKHEEFTRDSPQTSFNFKMDVRRPGRSPRRRSVSIISDDNSTSISHLKEKAGHTKSINPDWFSAVLSEGPSLCHTVALHREELEEDMPLSPYSVNNLNSNTGQNLKTYIPIVRESIASSICSSPICHVSKTPAKEIESSITKRRRLIQLCLKMLMCHRKAEKYFTSDLMVKISGVIVTKYQKEKLPDGYEVNFPISFEDRAILDDTIDEVVEEWITKVMTAADNKNKGLFQGKVSDGSEIFSADQLERAAAIAAVDRTNLYGPNFNYTPHENNDINDNKNTVNTSIQQTQSDRKDYITTPLCKPIVVDQSKYVPSSNKDPTKTPKSSDQSILPQNPRQLLITEPSWIAKEKRVVAFATCSIDIFGGTSEAFSITKHPFLAATTDNNAGVRPPFRWWLRTGTVDSDHTVDMSLDALISLGIATMHVISRTVPITLSFEIDLDPERNFTIINEAAKSISKKPSNVNKEGIDNNNTLRVPEHHDRYKKKMAYDEVIRVLINRCTFSTKPISVLREGLPYTLGVEVYDRDNEALIRCEKSFAIPVGAGLEVSSDELLDRIGKLRGLPYF